MGASLDIRLALRSSEQVVSGVPTHTSRHAMSLHTPRWGTKPAFHAALGFFLLCASTAYIPTTALDCRWQPVYFGRPLPQVHIVRSRHADERPLRSRLLGSRRYNSVGWVPAHIGPNLQGVGRSSSVLSSARCDDADVCTAALCHEPD